MNRRSVAQVSNLLYRRLPIGSSSEHPGAGGLEIRDIPTRREKSALRSEQVSGSWSQCMRASERGLSMNRDLLIVGMPTGCGIISPSPRPSPAGRGRVHIRAVVWLDALDLRAGGRRSTLSRWERVGPHPCGGMVGRSGFTRRRPSILPLPAGEGWGEGEVIVFWLAFEHCRFKVPMHARKRKAAFHEP